MPDHDAGRVTVLNGLSTIAITDNDLSVRVLPSFSSVAESVGWVELQVVATAGSTTVPLSVLLVTHQDTAHGRSVTHYLPTHLTAHSVVLWSPAVATT